MSTCICASVNEKISIVSNLNSNILLRVPRVTGRLGAQPLPQHQPQRQQHLSRAARVLGLISFDESSGAPAA